MELVLITSDLDKEIKVKMNASDFTMRVDEVEASSLYFKVIE